MKSVSFFFFCYCYNYCLSTLLFMEHFGNKFLNDIAFLPALLDDYGYYLIKEDTDHLFYNDNYERDHQNVDGSQFTISDFRMTDKKLGIMSQLDFLHWERDKYRAYIDTLRIMKLIGQCPHTEDFFQFLGRTALANISKCGYADIIHCDYMIVGTDRVYRATENERRQDVKMIHKVQAVLSGRDYLDAFSSHGALFPNLKAVYGGIFQLNEHEKKTYHRVCDAVCDVSVIWQCGIKRRRLLREKKIYRWDDPHFEDHFYEMLSSPSRIDIIRKMLSLSLDQKDDFLFPPKEDLLDKFPNMEKPVKEWVFVDFETDYQKCIYLMGYYTEDDGYQSEWADHLDPASEKPLMHKIYSTLFSYKQQGFLLCYFVAEMNFWKERCRFHKLYDYMDLFDGMLDLSHVFIYAPLIIKGVFNFKLKNIASKLYEMGYIQVKQPEGCADGAQSVDLAKEYFQTHSPELMKILERYNEFDCHVLYEMTIFLKKYYYLS